jgi:hypothetical protein
MNEDMRKENGTCLFPFSRLPLFRNQFSNNVPRVMGSACVACHRWARSDSPDNRLLKLSCLFAVPVDRFARYSERFPFLRPVRTFRSSHDA